jgi:hypothetical protein
VIMIMNRRRRRRRRRRILMMMKPWNDGTMLRGNDGTRKDGTRNELPLLNLKTYLVWTIPLFKHGLGLWLATMG